MKTIRHTATLYYYDGVQVFEGRDAIGGHYVAMLVGSEGGADRYLVVGASPENLRLFRVGALDLRTLLEQRPDGQWYLADLTAGWEQSISLEPQSAELSRSALMPDPGFVLHGGAIREVETALSEARARNNLVLELSLEPPEAAQGHRIHANTLSGILLHLQSLVKHAYAKSVRALSKEARRAQDVTDAHLLDVVVPAAPGSFRIVLEASHGPDLFGYSEVSRALEKLNELVESPDDPGKTLERVRQNQGHVAAAYIRLLAFLAKSRSGLSYSWATPSLPRAHSRSISEPETSMLVEVLSKVENIGVESVTLTGPLRKVDVDAGTWRLGSYGDEEERSGKIKPDGPSLSNLVTDRVYRFTCEEVLGEVSGTGRETHTLYLVEYQPFDS